MKIFIFDFDSTIFPGETLDEIIQFTLKDTQDSSSKIAAITDICNLGMSGAIPMAESLKRRLEIAAPNKETIAKYVIKNGDRINQDILKILQLLQERNSQVFVVSGGFEEWIKPLLAGIVPTENIHANKIKDSSLPMTYDNIIRRDKEQIIKELIHERNIANYEITMIGDGATDFSVFENGLAQYFWGTFFYTGTEARNNIVKKALDKNQLVFSDLKKFIRFVKDQL